MAAAVLGIGIDAVDVARFRAVLLRTPRFVERCFTEEERQYAARFPDPTERLAARFAAKEATMKAFGVGLGVFRFQDIAVVSTGAAPTLALSGVALERATQLGVGNVLVSLTHTALTAQAVVLLQSV
jgi:holo-[acyl-carrier protein] synthase